MSENERIIKNIEATLAIENCFLNAEDIDLLKSYLENNINEEEAVNIIKNKYIN